MMSSTFGKRHDLTGEHSHHSLDDHLHCRRGRDHPSDFTDVFFGQPVDRTCTRGNVVESVAAVVGSGIVGVVVVVVVVVALIERLGQGQGLAVV